MDVRSSENEVLLSIVTVVRNDLAGLIATLSSTAKLVDERVQGVVVDGSDNATIRTHLSTAAPATGRCWISEPDHGIYDAMNKGMDLSKGRYVLFLNAGDTLRAEFVDKWPALKALFARESCVLVGHSVESYGAHRWLHPGLGQEATVFAAPQHQATFYPRDFFKDHRYRTDRLISADGEYTLLALKTVGGAYLPAVVSEFGLGGVSSNYRSWRRVSKRMAEHQHDWRMKMKLRMKFVMWWLMPRVWFYSILARVSKYTTVGVGERVSVADLDIRRPAASFQ